MTSIQATVLSHTMQLITKLIILAFSLATITKATPHGFLFSGKELAGASVGCPRWKINYALINESGNQNGTGYFTVEKCFGSAQHVGDGIFDLDLDMATHSAVLTEKSTSSKLQGKLDRKLPPQCSEDGSCYVQGILETCYYGGGPDGNEPDPNNCGQL